MRKRRFSLFMILLAFTLVAAACGDDDDVAPAPATTTVAPAPAATTTAAPAATTTAAPAATTTAAPAATTTAAPAPAVDVNVGLVFDIGGRGDQSFNDSAAAGLDKAEGDLGITPSEASANQDGSNREELLSLQSEVNDLVFGVGFLFDVPMLNVALLNPDVNYGIVDGFIDTDFDGVSDAPDNVAMLLFAEEEGSFLVGAAAALKTTTKKVGFIGGVTIPLIQAFEAGFRAGVQAVDPSIEVIAQYVTEPPDFGGFNDPAAGKVIGQSMYEQGADIVYHAAGGTGAGLFQAAKEFSDSSGSKVWAIGVDSDQFNTSDESVREFILTSMLKRVDVSVFNTIQAQVNGTFEGGVQLFNLAVDGVGFATSGGFVDDIVGQLDDFKAKIVSGEIKVTRDPADYGG